VGVTLEGKALAYLLVDNRIGDGNETTPPDFNANMLWVAEAGWLPVATGMNRAGIAENPDEVGYDENGDGSINQVASVYYRIVEPGVLTLGPQNEGRNMYGLVVAPAVAPVVPRSVAVTKVGDGKVTLTWESGSAWSSVVSRGEKPEGPFEVVGAKVGGGLFEDTGLTNGKTYYYIVRGENAVGVSAASTVVPAVPAASPANVSAAEGERKAEEAARIRDNQNKARDRERRQREQQIGKELQGQLDAVNGLMNGYKRAAQSNMDRYTTEVDLLGKTFRSFKN
jgi:hypothetical protein